MSSLRGVIEEFKEVTEFEDDRKRSRRSVTKRESLEAKDLREKARGNLGKLKNQSGKSDGTFTTHLLNREATVNPQFPVLARYTCP